MTVWIGEDGLEDEALALLHQLLAKTLVRVDLGKHALHEPANSSSAVLVDLDQEARSAGGRLEVGVGSIFVGPPPRPHSGYKLVVEHTLAQWQPPAPIDTDYDGAWSALRERLAAVAVPCPRCASTMRYRRLEADGSAGRQGCGRS